MKIHKIGSNFLSYDPKISIKKILVSKSGIFFSHFWLLGAVWYANVIAPIKITTYLLSIAFILLSLLPGTRINSLPELNCNCMGPAKCLRNWSNATQNGYTSICRKFKINQFFISFRGSRIIFILFHVTFSAVFVVVLFSLIRLTWDERTRSGFFSV